MERASPRVRNPRLESAIKQAALSYAALARRVRAVAAEHRQPLHTNSSTIAHWVQGTHTPQPMAARFLAEALTRRMRRIVTPADLGLASDHEQSTELLTDPVASLAELGRHDVDRRHFIRTALFSVAAVSTPLSMELAERTANAEAG